tara:strand:- start:1349 stop:2431 length:1083 start_codon:yes stop_codon:yes gene_type:complete
MTDINLIIEKTRETITHAQQYQNQLSFFENDNTHLDAFMIVPEFLSTESLQTLGTELENTLSSIGDCSVEIQNLSNVCISAIVHHINKSDLLEFQKMVENDPFSIFDDDFGSNYAPVLFLESHIVNYQQNTHSTQQFDIILHFDWIKKFQEAYGNELTHYQKTEEFRKIVFKEAYNDYQAKNLPDPEDTSALNAHEQWKHHITAILYQTVFRKNPYLKEVFNIEDHFIHNDLEYQAKVDIHTHDDRILKHISQSYRYSTKKLGNLINNHNVEEIIVKLNAHGYFNRTTLTFNPPVEDVDSVDFPLYSPLEDNDEIVFPVTISSIYGYSDDVSLHSNNDIYNPYVSLYTVHIRCIQKSENI